MTTPLSNSELMTRLQQRMAALQDALDVLALGPDKTVVFEGRTFTFDERELLEKSYDRTKGRLNILVNDDLGCGRFGTLTVNSYRTDGGLGWPLT